MDQTWFGRFREVKMTVTVAKPFTNLTTQHLIPPPPMDTEKVESFARKLVGQEGKVAHRESFRRVVEPTWTKIIIVERKI